MYLKCSPTDLSHKKTFWNNFTQCCLPQCPASNSMTSPSWSHVVITRSSSTEVSRLERQTLKMARVQIDAGPNNEKTAVMLKLIFHILPACAPETFTYELSLAFFVPPKNGWGIANKTQHTLDVLFSQSANKKSIVYKTYPALTSGHVAELTASPNKTRCCSAIPQHKRWRRYPRKPKHRLRQRNREMCAQRWSTKVYYHNDYHNQA